MIVRFAVSFAFLLNGAAFAQSIFTIAGGGTDDGRPAIAAALYEPNSVAVDSSGNLYIIDVGSNRIRKVAAESGIISSAAGSGAEGFGGDGGPATEASFYLPRGLAVDGSGNLYIADLVNQRIRKVAAGTGVITTVAGSGRYGFSGDGGPATAASLKHPVSVAIGPSGNLYILEQAGDRVRKVDVPTGIITTVAGTTSRGFSGDGGPATAAMLNQPGGVAVDRSGNIYIADYLNNRVRKVSAISGVITTVAGTGQAGFGGDGGPATAALLQSVQDVAVDDVGDIYIGDRDRIRKVTVATGTITTIAGKGGTDGLRYSGDGGPATAAGLSSTGLAVDSALNVYIADRNHRIRKVLGTTGIITTVAGNGLLGYTGDGGPATAAEFARPYDLALDSAGNFYIADTMKHRVRKFVVATRTMTTVAGTGVEQDFGQPGGDGGPATQAIVGFPEAVALDPSGNQYIANIKRIRKVDATSGIITTIAGRSSSSGFSGDGDPATAASLYRVIALAMDDSGNIYAADFNNRRVRKVTAATGIITTIAGTGTFEISGDGGPATAASLSPVDVLVDRANNIYIADGISHRIRKIDKATGIITTVAGNGVRGSSGDGGPATAASLHAGGIALDRSGNLYIAEFDTGRIRKVTPATGIITTIVGSGVQGFAGDGGPATLARLRPYDITVDSGGNLYIADGSNRVRVVFACVNVMAPLLTSPAAGSTGVSTLPRLAWNAVSGAFRYDVLLDSVSPPRQLAASDIATTTFAPANLQPLTNYYWQVVAKGDPFCVPFSQNASEVRSFTTTASCDALGAIP